MDDSTYNEGQEPIISFDGSTQNLSTEALVNSVKNKIDTIAENTDSEYALKKEKQKKLSPESYENIGFVDDSVKLYFKEIGKIKLLTAEEEVKIAKRVAKGDKEAKDMHVKINK